MSIAINYITRKDLDEYDIFNCQTSMEDKNVESCDYNCMSYAFGACEWLCPIGPDEEFVDDVIDEVECSMDRKLTKDETDDFIDAFYDREYDNPFMIHLACMRMLEHLRGLRVISDFSELKNDEYGIAYRCCCDDFHFVRYDDGVYSHKMGSWEVEEIENENEGWGNRYDSEIIRFAMKKGDVDFVPYEET